MLIVSGVNIACLRNSLIGQAVDTRVPCLKHVILEINSFYNIPEYISAKIFAKKVTFTYTYQLSGNIRKLGIKDRSLKLVSRYGRGNDRYL